MAEYKIIGDAAAATNPLGSMLEGIGFPTRVVDQAGAPVIVQSEEVLRAADETTQQPSAVDTPIQLTFGGAQSVTQFDVSAAGAITCLVAGTYDFFLRVQFGRTGNPGAAIIVLRALLNGTQIGTTVYTRLDDGDNVVPGTFQGILTLAVNDVVTVEIYRDSQGPNAGGVFFFNPTLAGWGNAPSAQMIVNRLLVS